MMMNSRQQKSYNKIKALCAEHGSKLLSEEYISSRVPLEITCKVCGAPRKVYPYVIYNKDFGFSCRKCASNKKKPSLDYIRSLMAEQGAELLSTIYTSANDNNLKFKCSKCGNVGSISWHMIQMGSNKNFLCPACQPNCRTSPEVVRRYFEDHGVELLNDYKNNKEDLIFKCTSCGKPWHIGWQKVLAGRNKNFLCDSCNPFCSSKEKRDQKFEELKNLVESKGAKL